MATEQPCRQRGSYNIEIFALEEKTINATKHLNKRIDTIKEPLKTTPSPSFFNYGITQDLQAAQTVKFNKKISASRNNGYNPETDLENLTHKISF